MSNQELQYEDYNKRSFAVRGDRKKYTKLLKDVNARWNPRIKDGEGWLVPKENLENLKKIINSVNGSSNGPRTESPTKSDKSVKSRKNQHKYHREVSDSDSDSDCDVGNENSEK